MRKHIAVGVMVVLAGTVLTGCGTSSGGDVRGAASFIVSTDGGQTFTPRVSAGENKSIAGVDVLSMASSVQNPKTIYLGTRKSGILVTYNAGEKWQKIVFPPERVYGLVVNPQDDKVVYASGVHGGFARVYKSVNGGQEWQEVYTEPAKKTVITALAIDPAHPDTLYVGTSAGVIVKTTDGGASWANIYNAKKPVIRIKFDATDTQTVYFALYESGLLKSRDGGAHIENFTKKLAGADKTVARKATKRRSTRVYTLETDPRASGVAYVGTDTGIYRTTDYGVTWTELNLIASSEKLPIKTLAVNPHKDREIVYSVAHTLYRSRKDLTEWTPVQISASRVASVIQYDSVDANTIYIGMGVGKK